MRRDGNHMLGLPTYGKKSPRHAWMNGLYAAIQHLRKARHFGNILHWNTRVLNRFLPCRRWRLIPHQAVQAVRKVHEASFVREAQRARLIVSMNPSFS